MVFLGVVQHRCSLDDWSIVEIVRHVLVSKYNDSYFLYSIVDWCATGPCMNNGTCTVNQQLGTFQCKCVDGWVGVRCAYRK
jgi:hypothetical protein